MSFWLPLFLLGFQGLLIVRLAARHVRAAFALSAVPNLMPAAPRHWEKDDYWPFLSIVIEADTNADADDFENRMCGWLSQDYPHFELFVLTHDREGAGSLDAERAARRAELNRVVRLACESGRVRPLSLPTTQPVGTGIRAAHSVVRDATHGGWLLFVGTGVRCHCSTATTMMREALCRRADLLSVLPAFRRGSWREMAMFPVAANCLVDAVPVDRVQDDACDKAAIILGRLLLARPGALEEAFAGIDKSTRTESARLSDVNRLDDPSRENLCIGQAARAAGLRVRLARGTRIAAASLTSPVDGMLARWSDLFRTAAATLPLLRLRATGWLLARMIPMASIGVALCLRISNGGNGLSATLLALGLAHLVLEAGLDAWICRAARVPYAWLWLRFVGAGLTARALWRAIRHGGGDGRTQPQDGRLAPVTHGRTPAGDADAM